MSIMGSSVVFSFLRTISVLFWWINLAMAAAGEGGGAGDKSSNMAAHGVPPSPAEIRAGERNSIFSNYLIMALGAFGVLPLIYRTFSVLFGKIRLLVSLNAENQRYFAAPLGEWIPWLKKHILYAPLFRVRHNREMQLSRAVNIGTLPTRFQAFFLAGYVASNIIVCTYHIDYSDKITMLKEIRNRSGVMATVNMVPLFLMAGRNNPLIQWMGISFDTFNLIHRWLGRIVVLETLVHTFTWMAGKVIKTGWDAVKHGLTGSTFIKFGFIACCAFTFLLLHSPSALRHAFYETFLLFHIMAAALACAGVWYHLSAKSNLEHWLKYLKVAIILWAADRGLRLLRIVYRNFGRKMTTARVEALPGDAARVTIRMPRPWKFQPGQHLYLYMPQLGLWTSHPFTIAWSSDGSNVLVQECGDEKLPIHRNDISIRRGQTMALIIRRRTGFTDALFRRAVQTPEKEFTSRVLVEGPYGKIDTLSSYGTVMLVAGGVGITHPLPFVRELVAGYANKIVATRRITLVWIIQTPDYLEWIRPWMSEILAMDNRREVLKIQLFVTRPKSPKEIHSPSSTVQMFPGRPNFDALLNIEIEAAKGKIGVAVCGCGSLSDDVRYAVRHKQHLANIDFIEEAFSW